MRDAIEAGNINIKALAKELAYSKEAFLLATNTLREIRAKI